MSKNCCTFVSNLETLTKKLDMKRLLFLLTMLMTFTGVYSQEQDTVHMEAVVITGVRADSKTPVSQKTLTAEEIQENYQGEEMSIILDKTPSITSSSDGGHSQGYTYFRLRGIDQTRVNMTLNGAPLNEPEDQGVYFSNYPSFANNIASMQIQRGVGTSSNGVASYAGSINFESHSGLNKGTSVETGMGSFNTMRFSASNSTGRMDNGFALYSNFSTFGTDGFKDHSGSVGYSFFLSGGYYGDNNVIKFTGFTGRSMNQMAWFAVSEDDITVDPTINYNSDRENDDFMQSYVQLQHTVGLGNHATLTTTGYYNRLDGNWDLDLVPLGAGTDVLNYQLGSNFYGLMTNYRLSKDNMTFNLGAHSNMYERDHAMAILPDENARLYKNTGFKNETSSFAKIAYDLGRFTLFADGQFRYVTFAYDGAVEMEDVNWAFFNPKGGVTFTMSDKLNLYASVGQAHREPTRTDMFGGEDDLITFYEVTPEEVLDYELGTNYTSDKFTLQANLYYMDFQNEITLIGALGSNGLPLMTNVENSFRSGVELDASLQVGKHVVLTNNTNYSYNRITDGGVEFQPLYTPDLVVNQGIVYRPNKALSAGLNAKYHSESFIDFDNTHVTPSFIVMNANITYNVDVVTFKLQVNNITDQEYFTNGYSVGDTRYFFVNAPRSVYGTIALNF